MLLRRMIQIGLCLATLATAARGQSKELLASQAYQDGLSALEDHLPDLAIRRFEAALAELPEESKEVREINLRLGEALVRAGRAARALKTLADYPKNHQALFWKAYAFLTLGQLREAEATFSTLSHTENPTRRDYANLARARILASLHDDRELSDVFTLLGESKEASVVAESQLLHASVLLEKNLQDDCTQLLSGITPATPRQVAFLSFLKGRLAFAEEKFVLAESILQPLVESSANLSREVYHSCAFAYGETLHALKKNDQAVEFSLDFLARNQDSLYLHVFFERLILWTRGNEVLRDLYLQRLKEWSPTPPPPHGQEVGDSVINAVAASAALPLQPLLPYALLHRALLLAEKNDQASVSQAKFLLARLRVEAPQSSLVPRSLLETSQMHLAQQKREASLAALRTLELISRSPTLRAHASELTARIQFENQSFEDAAASFARIREHLTDVEEGADVLNEGISLMLADNKSQFGALLKLVTSPEVLISLQLEGTLVRASNLDASARDELDRFLQRHGNHPRAVEARLAFAELAVFFEPRDLTMASVQLAAVDPGQLTDTLALRHILTQLRLAELTGEKAEWDSAVEGANAYLANRPEAPLKPAIRIKLGEAFYLNNDFGKAQLAFQQVANDPQAESYHEVALFFAGRSARKVTTPEARNEAVLLFKAVVALKGALADDARIKLAQTYLDSGAHEETINVLAPLLLPTKDRKSQQLHARLLQAEALRAQGTPKSDEEALAIYANCLTREDLSYADSNHIHYLQGLTLEQLDRSEDALAVLYRVVNRENLPKDEPVTEWGFYYDCGSKTIGLLEDNEEWAAALAVARKLARSGGPKSADFTARAKAIQLKHMIWEDE